MDAASLVAQGWERLPTRAFSAAIGPTFASGEPGARTVALPSNPDNANDHIGSVHGGVLMTFSDIALGVAVVDAIGGPNCATVQLQYQFAGAVPVGSLVTCEPEVVRRTRQLVFVRGIVKADGKVVGSTEGIFKVFESSPQTS